MRKYSFLIALLLLLSPFTTVSGAVGDINTFAGTGPVTYYDDTSPLPVDDPHAQLNWPNGVVVTPNGDRYIADTLNHRIRKVVTDLNTGETTITTIAGISTAGFSGDDGPATDAAINHPRDIALDSAGNIYFSDNWNHRIRMIATDGIITTLLGGDGSLLGPTGILIDSNDNLYFSDSGNHRVLKLPNGASTPEIVAGTGVPGVFDTGIATESALNFPTYLTIDESSENVYISDTDNNRIRMIDSFGNISTVAGSGTAGYNGNGNPLTIELNSPLGLAFKPGTGLYIADHANHRIRLLANNLITTIAGTGERLFNGDGDQALTTTVDFPAGVTIDSSGDLLIADSGNLRIRKIDLITNIVSTEAGSFHKFGGSGRPAISAQLYAPHDIAVATSGNIYIADTGNHRIRAVDATSGVISTIAGNGTSGFSGENIIATDTSVMLNAPSGIATDSSNNIYISDSENNRVRKIDSDGVISTIVGTGNIVDLDSPSGLAVGPDGFLYIADRDNHRILRKDLSNSTDPVVLAGTGIAGFGGDNGLPAVAQLDSPTDVAFDADGNLYIADSNNHRIRKVFLDPNDFNNGTIITVAGRGTEGFSGDNGQAISARLNYPLSIAFDANNNLLISDGSNARIRKVTPTGIVTTVAGSDIVVHNGDARAAIGAGLTSYGIATNTTGTLLYIADYFNDRVRVVELNIFPTASYRTITTSEDEIYSFSLDDFRLIHNESLVVSNIEVTTLPDLGTLTLDDVPVVIGDTIDAASIPSLKYVPVENDYGITHTSFTFTMTDNQSDIYPVNTIIVDVIPVNDAPVISMIPSLAVNEDTPFQLMPFYHDIEHHNLTFSCTNCPPWLTLTLPDKGTIEGRPDENHIGTYYNIVITVTDEYGASTPTPPFSITVNNVNDPPAGILTINYPGFPAAPRENQTLAAVDTLADADGPGQLSLHYTWKRGSNEDNEVTVGSDRNTYTLSDNDVGQQIRVIVSYIDSHGTYESIASDRTLAVENENDLPTGQVTITGLPFIGNELTANNNIFDADGFDTADFVYEWRRIRPDNSEQVVGANSPNYTLVDNSPTDTDIGNRVSVTITYQDLGTPRNLHNITSAATSVIGRDTDGDGIGDSADPDIDGDGMDNEYEIANGHDPFVDDAAGNSDADNFTNLDEFLNGTDPNLSSPTVTAPADVSTVAAALLTNVELGTPTVVDPGNENITAVADRYGPFLPGTHTIRWSATNSGGKSPEAAQKVHITPLIEFSLDQRATPGGSVTVNAYLNGPLPENILYPIEIPFTVSGTALNPDDHDLSSSNISIPQGGLSGGVTFDIAAAATVGREITIQMGTPVANKAVVGTRSTHTVAITDQPLPPRASLQATQGSVDPTTTIVANTTSVVITALPGDDTLYDYNWSSSDNALVDADSDTFGYTFTISDPTTLAPGVYNTAVEITEKDSDPPVKATAKLLLRVTPAAPSLTNVDSDGDGLNDNDPTELHDDSDGDGVADYRDAISVRHVLQTRANNQRSHLIETQPGLQLKLGRVAFTASSVEPTVSADAVFTHSTVRSPRDDYPNVGGLFDFEVHGLPFPGASVPVVVPQHNAIPALPHYRKLVTTGWQDFVVDSNNSLSSAAGAEGDCPPPGDPAYSNGLTSGHWCVQLQIEDGGPNDADGVADSVITDPGGVSSEPESAQPPPRSPSNGSNTGSLSLDGGGSVHLITMMILLFLHWWRLQGARACRHSLPL